MEIGLFESGSFSVLQTGLELVTFCLPQASQMLGELYPCVARASNTDEWVKWFNYQYSLLISLWLVCSFVFSESMTKPRDLCLLGKCSATELNPLSQSNLLYQTSQFQTKKPWPRDGQLAQGHTTASHNSLLITHFPVKGWKRPREEAVIVRWCRYNRIPETGKFRKIRYLFFTVIFWGGWRMCVYMFVCVCTCACRHQKLPSNGFLILFFFGNVSL